MKGTSSKLGRQTGLAHALQIALVALLGAVGLGQCPADHQHLAVAQRVQPGHQRGDRRTAVHRHTGVARVPVVDQHVRRAAGAQAAQHGRARRIGHAQDQCVHTACQQQVGGAGFVRELVVGGDGHDGIATGHRGLRDALQALGKHRVEQGGQHHAQRARALRAQRARAGIGLVAQLARGGLHPFAHQGRDLARRVEHARNRRRRDAGAAGHVANGQRGTVARHVGVGRG
jgi:hypothetical protein